VVGATRSATRCTSPSSTRRSSIASARLPTRRASRPRRWRSRGSCTSRA
jgi:hypothetical protein